jgi:hypothetical protein
MGGDMAAVSVEGGAIEPTQKIKNRTGEGCGEGEEAKRGFVV